MRTALITLLCLSALLTAISGCSSTPKLSAQQRAVTLALAMTKSEVINIMGRPIASEIKQRVEEWHFCTSRYLPSKGYEYSLVAVYFVDGKLISTRPYSKLPKSSNEGSCLSAVRGGNYSEPTEIREYRIKR